MTELAGLIELESPGDSSQCFAPAHLADDRNLQELFARLVQPVAIRTLRPSRLTVYSAATIIEADLDCLAADLDHQTLILRARLKAAV